MNAFTLTLLGHAIEVLGVFFLSVEAIKLQNLYKLRDHFLLPLDHTLRPSTFQPSKTSWSLAELRTEHAAVRHFYLSHYAAGLAALIVFAMIVARTSPAAVALFSTLASS